MSFVELSDGTLINSSQVFSIKPRSQANRVDLVNGAHFTLSDEEAERWREALKAPKRRPAKD